MKGLVCYLYKFDFDIKTPANLFGFQFLSSHFIRSDLSRIHV